LIHVLLQARRFRICWVFAEFEINQRRERQLKGIAAAKARGVYQERKPHIDPVEVHRLYVEEKMGATAISHQLGSVEPLSIVCWTVM
jgi:DNA invertase Pin-like site-specific DNA recombinase